MLQDELDALPSTALAHCEAKYAGAPFDSRSTSPHPGRLTGRSQTAIGLRSWCTANAAEIVAQRSLRGPGDSTRLRDLRPVPCH